jgi:short-subunit dehydrogenase
MPSTQPVALITGASEGIGAALAGVFRQHGMRLALSALPTPGFSEDQSADQLVIPGDLTVDGFAEKLVERTLDHFGRIDVLVNNAGIGLYAPALEAPLALVRRLFELNVFAPLRLAQLVAPAMRRQSGGIIVNMGSVGGGVSLPWSALYCASKFALQAVNDSLRRELGGAGIHVMKVCPGIVATAFRDHVLAGQAPVGVVRIRRVVTSQQVAESVWRGIERRRANVYVPWLSKVFVGVDFVAPRLMDWYCRRTGAPTMASKWNSELDGTLRRG